MRYVFNPKDKQCVHAKFANAATDHDPTRESISEDHERISGDEVAVAHLQTNNYVKFLLSGTSDCVSHLRLIQLTSCNARSI